MNRITMGKSGDEQGNYVASNMQQFVLDISCMVIITYSNEDESWVCET